MRSFNHTTSSGLKLDATFEFLNNSPRVRVMVRVRRPTLLLDVRRCFQPILVILHCAYAAVTSGLESHLESNVIEEFTAPIFL